MDVAGATESRWRSCQEMTHEWSGKSCDTDYGTISSYADRCCGGGPSKCPVPQLCEDPKAFDPGAKIEYLCNQRDVTEVECPKDCNPSQHEGVHYCSCIASDDTSCREQLPGEIHA